MNPVKDLVGIGIGPFNLGLAALVDPLDIDAVFFERAPSFIWHPGLLLEDAKLQVPFLADLVTFADPTSKYSFLAYLHDRGRLQRFYLYERLYVLRREYSDYCRWVADRLPSCRFSRDVVRISDDQDGWVVDVRDPDGRIEHHRARAVVAGVGSRPALPLFATDHLGPTVFHSSDYLFGRQVAQEAGHVTVVGSGQSAGEIVADLLDRRPPHAPIDWLTRSAFLGAESTPIGVEHVTPEYGRYFHGLAEEVRDRTILGQDLLHKGMSPETSARIFDHLYAATIDADEPGLRYVPGCSLQALEPDRGSWRLTWSHPATDRTFSTSSDVVILATGYDSVDPPLARPSAFAHDSSGRLIVDHEHRARFADGRASTLFVQNVLYSHGVGAPDLGMGPQRNASIINQLCGRKVYVPNQSGGFQTFDPLIVSSDGGSRPR